MKIQSSSLALASQSQSSASLTQSSLQKVENGTTVTTNLQAAQTTVSTKSQACLVQTDGATVLAVSSELSAGNAATLQLSESAQNTSNALSGNLPNKCALSGANQTNGTQIGGIQLSSEQELKLNMIQEIIQSLHSGSRLKMVGLNSANEGYFWGVFASNFGNVFQKNSVEAMTPTFSQSPAIGVKTTINNKHYQESQSMSFAASGSIQTADGKSIAVNISLDMSRRFYSQNTSISQSVTALTDPLVLNFAGGAAELTDQKFSFDLDCDGVCDQMSFVGEGSGLLALDKNGDGKVNDGSELFGTQSGDGFADLAAYDDDANGWIDENDDIYDQLRIWTKNADGSDQLLALGVKGVGAIYLGNVSTDFAVKNEDNTTNGAIRSSGIYLNEDGSSSTIQHVDFAI